MKKVGLIMLFVSTIYASGQDKEIFKPRQAEVIDCFMYNSTLYIHTTKGWYQRVMHSVYTRTEYPDQKTQHLNSPPDSITIEKGALHITHKSIYNRRFSNYSVRYNDSNYVCTYSGVFSKNKVLDLPCAGNLRLHNNQAYVCFGGLAILNRDTLAEFYCDEIDAEFVIDDKNLSVINDIAFDNDKWIVNTALGLFVITNNRITDTLLTPPGLSKSNRANGRFIGVTANSIEGFISNYWFLIGKESNTVQILGEFEGDIKHIDETSRRFITTSEFIYDLSPNSKKYTNLKLNLHGTFSVKSKLYGFSDDGLFLLEINDNELSAKPLILNEFNKHSLRITHDSVYIGSVNGLWSFSKTQMPQPFNNSNTTLLTSFKSQQYLIYAIIVLTIIICLLLLGIFKTKRPTFLNPKHNSDKDTVLDYIDSNLTTVTILGILQEFGLSQKLLYEMFSPVKPGEIIKAKRLEKLEYYQKQGKTNKELAVLTGFSKDYITKVLVPDLIKKRSTNSK